jgi:monoamine oxidase
MADAYADVIIVGGGVAGLAAADVLSAAGKSVLLLEGRPRLGGRIDTRHDPAWPLPIERGAEFIHGKPKETWEVVQAGGCSLYDVTDEHWVYQRGRLTRPADFYEQVGRVLEQVSAAGFDRRRGATPDVSFDAFLAAHRRGLTPEAKKWARLFVEGFNAADAKQVSCAWLAGAQQASDDIEGDRLFRVYAGYDRVVQFLKTALGENVRVELSTVVRHVRWEKSAGGAAGKVTVEAVRSDETVPLDRRTFEARRLIVTAPVGVLQADEGPGALVFDPPLPGAKQAAIAALRMGAVVKVVLRFREAWWEKRIPELDFVHGADPFPTWWTTLPIRTPVLTGWAGGPAADALSGKPTGEILSAAVGSLAKVLAVPRRTIEGQLVDAHVCDWKTEPLSRGAYSYAAVGGAGAAKDLAKPVGGTLYFAGEATHAGMSGTVAGAIASGRRAGREAARP